MRQFKLRPFSVNLKFYIQKEWNLSHLSSNRFLGRQINNIISISENIIHSNINIIIIKNIIYYNVNFFFIFNNFLYLHVFSQLHKNK